MFMSVVERSSEFEFFPELAGARVLITGLTCEIGFDVARAFAEHKARLVIVSPDCSPAMVELSALLAESASEIRLFNEPSASPDDVVRHVQRAAQEFGGFDAVINLVGLDAADVRAFERASDVEALIAARLEEMMLVTQVAANRMRITWTEGSILNVVTMSGAMTGRAGLVADVVRSMIAQFTLGQARQWAGEGLRINAIAPQSSIAALLGGTSTVSDADIASTALYFASRKGRSLSGHLLDAEGLAQRRCGG